MTRKSTVCAIVAMSLTVGGFSFAQDNRERDERGRNGNAQRNGQQDRRNNEARQQQRPQGQGPWQEQNRSYNNGRRDQRGAGPDHAYYAGARMPAQYRSHQYVVDDWRGHRLSAPPRGYHWVQTGGDYVLVAIATGIILQLLLNN
jgi:Ni/Co efflux regulator RcnB